MGTMPSHLFLLVLLLGLLLAPSPFAAAGRVFGKPAAEKDAEEEGSSTKDWTRSRHGRKLETHVDEDEVLNLLRHDPVEVSAEEAQDWQHVKRKLAEARDKSGWFHRVEDAFVPPNSALRSKKKMEEKAAAGKAETEVKGDAAFVRPKDAQAAAKQEEIKATETRDKKTEAEKEFGIFERARKKLMRS